MESVLIVDDHSTIRRGLNSLIEELGWAVTVEASSLAQARAVWRNGIWSLAVFDLNLPDGDGLDLVREIRDTGCTKPILVHSLLPDSAVASRVIKTGGNGFVNKGAQPEEVINALRKVSSGGHYVSPEYAEQMALTMAGGVAPVPHERLSEREYKVMCLLAAGKTPSQVAENIGCNVNTISTYRSRILKKLDLKTSMDIVRYALTRRLVTL